MCKKQSSSLSHFRQKVSQDMKLRLAFTMVLVFRAASFSVSLSHQPRICHCDPSALLLLLTKEKLPKRGREFSTKIARTLRGNEASTYTPINHAGVKYARSPNLTFCCSLRKTWHAIPCVCVLYANLEDILSENSRKIIPNSPGAIWNIKIVCKLMRRILAVAWTWFLFEISMLLWSLCLFT